MVELNSITGIIVSGSTGLFTGFVGGLLQGMWAARKKIDESVRAARLEHYRKLWRMSELLPKLPVADNVTYDDLRKLSAKVRDWYFREGGMYLSESSRKRYGAVQEAISHAVGGKVLIYAEQDTAPHMQETEPKEGMLRDDEYGPLHFCLRALRDSMATDLLARRRTLTIRGWR